MLSNIGINCNLILDRNIELLQHHMTIVSYSIHMTIVSYSIHTTIVSYSIHMAIVSFVPVAFFFHLSSSCCYCGCSCCLFGWHAYCESLLSAFYTSFIFLARLHLDYGDIIYDGHLVNHYTETMRYWLGRWVTRCL